MVLFQISDKIKLTKGKTHLGQMIDYETCMAKMCRGSKKTLYMFMLCVLLLKVEKKMENKEI